MAPRGSLPDPIDDLWRAFATSGDPDLRERLLLHYSPLVKLVVSRLIPGLPGAVDRDDLISDGLIGLIDAIGKFDVERGLRFQTYATTRIRGAIVDGLRASDWVPRQVRTKIRDAAEARAVLEHELGRTPTDRETAAALGVTIDALSAIHSEASYTQVMSLDGAEWVGAASRTLPGSGDAMPPDLHPAVGRLHERDQVVLALYYWERLTLHEIGQVLGVSESRISQVHSRALVGLRRILSSHAA